MFDCVGLLIFALSIRAQVPLAIPRRKQTEPGQQFRRPATLTSLGYMQFETRSPGANTSPEFGTRIGINQVTKLTVLAGRHDYGARPRAHADNTRPLFQAINS
jgi:hypothetical protein